MSEKEKLQKQQAAISAKLSRIIDKEIAEENKKLLGKCFKYRNSYGCAIHGKWWLYIKIVKISGRTVYAFEFQNTSNSTVEFRTNYPHYSNAFLGKDYIPISNAEFEKALRSLKSRIEKMNP